MENTSAQDYQRFCISYMNQIERVLETYSQMHDNLVTNMRSNNSSRLHIYSSNNSQPLPTTNHSQQRPVNSSIPTVFMTPLRQTNLPASYMGETGDNTADLFLSAYNLLFPTNPLRTPVNTGITHEQFSESTETYSLEIFQQLDNEYDEECPITRLPFGEDNRTITIIKNCDHAFDTEALERWTQTNITCPVCRQNIVISTPPPG